MERPAGEFALDLRCDAAAAGNGGGSLPRRTVWRGSEDMASLHDYGSPQRLHAKQNDMKVDKRRISRFLLVIAGTVFAAALLVFRCTGHLAFPKSAGGLATPQQIKERECYSEFCRLGNEGEFEKTWRPATDSKEAQLQAKALALVGSFVAFTKASEYALKGLSGEVQEKAASFLVSLFAHELAAIASSAESAFAADSKSSCDLLAAANEAIQTSRQPEPASHLDPLRIHVTKAPTEPLPDSARISRLEAPGPRNLFSRLELQPEGRTERLIPSVASKHSLLYVPEATSAPLTESQPTAPPAIALFSAPMSYGPPSHSDSLAHEATRRNHWPGSGIDSSPHARPQSIFSAAKDLSGISLGGKAPTASQDTAQRAEGSTILSGPATSPSWSVKPQQSSMATGDKSKPTVPHGLPKPFYGKDHERSKHNMRAVRPLYPSLFAAMQPNWRKGSRIKMAKAPGSERLPKEKFQGVAQGEPARVGVSAVPSIPAPSRPPSPPYTEFNMWRADFPPILPQSSSPPVNR
ncbi:hypothetical protein, conserved [Eimeria praecox]|uniref:Uncharacterized protein n=1 Tax=Eimeria praecox TaxID=51316 RepID=U6GA18_9EIME|nr:hypothetical protein, conserved [Eimeria praecox]